MDVIFPRPASTVVLARPATAGFEVFLVRRHDNVAFMGGAHVFPGGRVDDADYIEDASRWCDGVTGAVARMRNRTEEQAIAFHVAAIRELFEEAGVLLARDQRGIIAIDAGDERFIVSRRQLFEHRLTVRDLAERERRAARLRRPGAVRSLGDAGN